MPPKTRNRARPALSSKQRGWGWTHYFVLGDGSIVGHKMVDNVSAMARWIYEQYGPMTFHLGRAYPDPQTGQFYFEPWPFPIDYLV